MKNIQAIRGMNDILPQDTPYWRRIEAVCQSVAAQYAYQEIRFPALEKTQLFKRSIGDVTDIVEKEMYTFLDRNGDSLSLRPEGTAGCVRAGIEHGLLYNQIQRLWYMGPMFRHERPQKGRTRQFHQFGIEAFGLSGPDIDIEVILLSKRIWDRLGLTDKLSLEINTLGSFEQRESYKANLVQYFKSCHAQLDADSERRLESNPLRILDSKNPEMQDVIHNAPNLIDFIDGEPKAHFESLCDTLTQLGVSFKINPHLVRGLDYYCFTVFEWVTEHLGAQGTVCAGGRYDGLVEQLGGKATPGSGFAMGLERTVLLLQDHEQQTDVADCYLVSAGDHHAFAMAEKLRGAIPTLKLAMHCGGQSFGAQFKKADKSGAQYALVLGDAEIEKQMITVKNLRERGAEQKTFTFDALINYLKG